MSCQAATTTRATTTIKVTEGASVITSVPKTGVLRIERGSSAMTGAAQISSKAGATALQFTDGSSIYLRG